MKIRTLITTLLLMLLSLATFAQGTKEAYAVLNSGTLTFYYNDSKPSGAYNLNDTENKPAWESSAEDITTVVFDESFAGFKPKSCYCWFNGFKNLTEIVDIKNLKTDDVISFKAMFQDCPSLQSVDLSGFNTANATDISCMFRRAGIQKLDLSSFITEKVTEFGSMFEGCASLEEIDLHTFNTKSATNFWCMFLKCSELTKLDLPGFDTKNNPRTGHMFQDCSKLTTILVSDAWSNGTPSDDIQMFYNCNSLVGGQNTTVGSVYDGSYARIDGGTSQPGYFTKSTLEPYVKPSEPYVVVIDGTATFYYNNNKSEDDLKLQSSSNNWSEDVRTSVTKVVFDKSFKDYKPTSCENWFRMLINLTEISGMKEYLNTEDVTDMTAMFYSCKQLTNLDLSNFNMAKVTNIRLMFTGCRYLQTIFVGEGWVTSSVTVSYDMFQYCNKLYGGKGTAYNKEYLDASYAHIDGGSENPGYLTKSGEPAFIPDEPYVTIKDGTLTFYFNNSKPSGAYDLNDTENKPDWESSAESITKVVFDESFAEYKPTSCYCWFNGFKNLTQIVDITNLKTDEVLSFKGMFQDCSSLQSVDVSGFNTAKATDISCMFRRVGIKELNLSNFNTEKVTEFGSMFEGSSSLEKLDIHSFNTKSATNFWCMFLDCSNLKELDLSGFDTKNNPRTGHMFQGCSNLITIFVGDSWANGSISDSEQMFYNCEKLVGGKGTTVTYIDDSYARIDGGTENPGYFTKSGEKPYEPNKPYVIIKDGIATFYTATSIPEGAKPIRTSSDDSNWPVSLCRTITNVVFDQSFKEYKPFKISSWFRDCDNLTEVSGMENINTEELEYMDEMFQFCNNLKYVDFTGFNTAKVTDMTRVFWGCENLAYVLVDENWNTTSVTKSAGMFGDCYKLYGGKGTAYNADYTDVTYARIDGGADNPGYFTKSGEKPFEPNTAYVVISNGTLTFYYNETKPEGAFSLNTENNIPDWNSLTESVTKVVFDESFANYFPLSCAYWFYGCKNLTEFEGMKNLNTSQATTLKAMFQDCQSLESVDLSNFKTDKVIDMSCMFRRCYKLPTIDFSSFNVDNAKDFRSMFEDATGLQSLNLQSFKTNSETDLYFRCMFIGCTSLKTLDISGFATKSVTNMEMMFSSCNELGTIFVGDNWSTESVTASGCMFESCYNLVGGKGTDFGSNNITAAFARIDGGTENPGYFTKSGEPEYERIVESVEVATLPKLEYVEGEEFDVENGVINVAFNVGSTKKINLSEATITGYDKTKVGEQTVTVSYKGFETTLTVTVAPKQSTPVSDVANSQDNVKVWSFNSTIYIETAPDTKYTIIDLNGRILKSSATKSSREEIRLNQSGIVVVIINNASYKLAL